MSTFNNQSVLQIKDAIPIDTMNAIGRSNPDHTLGIGKDGDPQYTLSTNNCHAVCYGISAFDSNAMKSPNPHSGIYEASTARTLDLNGGSPACNQGGMAIVCLNDQCGQRMDVSEDVCGTLLAETHGHPPVIAVYDARGQGDGEIVPTMAGDHFGHISDYTAILLQTYSMQAFGDYKGSDAASAVKSRDYKDATDLIVAAVDCRNGTANPDINGTLQAKEQGQNLNSNNVVLIWPEVRRLTPLECTRLQGFPDGWLDIGDWTDENGKLHKESDAPKYKAAGNSIALPFWEWLARRICAQYERPITMASLFDGVGGFPLAFSRCGAKPVWASEIEQYPIAVTKKHFPE